MKKVNNTIQTGDINITFYGCKSHRRWYKNKYNNVLLYIVKIKNSTSYCVAGREIKDQEVEKKCLSTFNIYRRGMSGCIEFREPVCITGSGYITLGIPLLLNKREFSNYIKKWKCIPISPVSFFSRENINNILLNTFLVIAKQKKLNKKDIQKINWGAFSGMLPLLYTFIREERYTIDEIELEEIKYSFIVKAKTPFGEFYLSKGRVSKEETKLGEYEAEVFTSAKDKIYIFSKYKKKIIYIFNESLPYLIGWERYREYKHAPCRIDLSQLKNSYLEVRHLVEDRLGDLIILPYTTKLSNAQPHQLQKIQFYNCEYSPEEGVLVVHSPKGMLVHPEHGELILWEGKYHIYQVPYIQRGHD